MLKKHAVVMVELLFPQANIALLQVNFVHNAKYPKYTASKGTRHHLGFDNV